MRAVVFAALFAWVDVLPDTGVCGRDCAFVPVVFAAEAVDLRR